MSNDNYGSSRWELPFSEVPELEFQAEFGSLALVPVEADRPARIELSERSADHIAVHVDKHDTVVRVALEPHGLGGWQWLSGWECRATLYVPSNVRAHVQTNAGSMSVRDLVGCELGIKATAGKIDLANVHGLLHLSADAGSINGRDVGGFLDIETQAGSVRLDVSELQPGEHRMRASMGSVRLELARGLDVCIETHASLGSVRNRYPSRPGAPARLVINTDMGSVRIDESTSVGARPQPMYVQEVRDVQATQEARARQQVADPELERVLKMVEAGELSAKDADELLDAMGRA